MSDRGMKKWAPYKALIEHEPSLTNMRKNRNKIDKPKISSDVAEEINNVLVNYNQELLRITFFKNGEIIHVEDKINKIDQYDRKLILFSRRIINFADLLYLVKIS